MQRWWGARGGGDAGRLKLAMRHTLCLLIVREKYIVEHAACMLMQEHSKHASVQLGACRYTDKCNPLCCCCSYHLPMMAPFPAAAYLLLVLDLSNCLLTPVNLRWQVVCIQAAMAEAGQLVALAHKLAEAQGVLLLILFMGHVRQAIEAKLREKARQERVGSVVQQASKLQKPTLPGLGERLTQCDFFWALYSSM